METMATYSTAMLDTVKEHKSTGPKHRGVVDDNNGFSRRTKSKQWPAVSHEVTRENNVEQCFGPEFLRATH